MKPGDFVYAQKKPCAYSDLKHVIHAQKRCSIGKEPSQSRFSSHGGPGNRQNNLHSRPTREKEREDSNIKEALSTRPYRSTDRFKQDPDQAIDDE